MNHWIPPSPEDVRALREQYGLTQAQLAELASVTTRHVQRYEAPAGTIDHRSPSFHVWELLRVRLGLTSYNPRKILKRYAK